MPPARSSNPTALSMHTEVGSRTIESQQSTSGMYIITTRVLGSKFITDPGGWPPSPDQSPFSAQRRSAATRVRSSRNCCPPSLPSIQATYMGMTHTFRGTCSPRDPTCHRRSTLSYSSIYEQEPVAPMRPYPVSLEAGAATGLALPPSQSASGPVLRTVVIWGGGVRTSAVGSRRHSSTSRSFGLACRWRGNSHHHSVARCISRFVLKPSPAPV